MNQPMGSIDGKAASAEAPCIPIVDFATWHNAANDAERKAVAKELIDGCRSIGFVYIINHGVPEAILDEAFAMSARFYNLTHEEKMQAAHPPGTAVHRGYTHPGRLKETIDYDADEETEKKKRARGDLKESYEVGSEQNPIQSNIWPPEELVPGFRDLMLKFYWECNRVTEDVLRVLAAGIGLKDPEHLTKKHSGIYNQLRLAHYPPIPADSLEKDEADRIGAHTDFSTFTLVFQDDCGGLQVQNPFKPQDKSFVDATPIKGACVMNIGDPLMRWSNDLLMSNRHRVGLPPLADRIEGEQRMTRERYSFPYFVASDPDAMIETFPECIDAAHPQKYETVSTEAYHKLRFAEYMDQAEVAAAA